MLRTAVDVSLIMVCEEEELSPVQKAEHRKALQVGSVCIFPILFSAQIQLLICSATCFFFKIEYGL